MKIQTLLYRRAYATGSITHRDLLIKAASRIDDLEAALQKLSPDAEILTAGELDVHLDPTAPKHNVPERKMVR